MLLSILFALMGGLGWILFGVSLMTDGFNTKYLTDIKTVTPPAPEKIKVEYKSSGVIKNTSKYEEDKVPEVVEVPKVEVPKVEVPKVELPDTFDWVANDLLALVHEKYNSIGGYCYYIKTLSDGRIAIQLERKESPKHIIEFKDIRKNLNASTRRDEAAETLRNKAVEAEIARL